MESNTTTFTVSKIYEAIGLGGMDIAIPILLLTILCIVLIVVVILQIKKQNALTARFERFMQGEEAMSLEGQIARMAGDVSRLKQESRAYANDIDLLFSRQECAFQKLGIMKYDAFSEMGGKMSFCLALLDEHDDGVVINSVHSTNGCYSYAKRIRGGNCDIQLSPEEQAAIRRATQGEQ
ncbi:MAG: DUF4446 family protein [Lachnospiraceae bacterium]|nr:DUF4446 family protein [Lachnospiraceae bacterium]